MSALAAVVPARRRGLRNWGAGFRALLRWNVTRMRLLLPVVSLVQIFTGAGLVLGFSLLYDDIEAVEILFLATGAVVITLVTVGLVMGPVLCAHTYSMPTPALALRCVPAGPRLPSGVLSGMRPQHGRRRSFQDRRSGGELVAAIRCRAAPVGHRGQSRPHRDGSRSGAGTRRAGPPLDGLRLRGRFCFPICVEILDDI